MNALWPHLPALQVVIPLIGSLLAGLLRRPIAGFALATAITWIAAAIVPFRAKESGAHIQMIALRKDPCVPARDSAIFQVDDVRA